ncbi:MAG: Histidinol phosphate phosphatase protein [Candidatus Thermoplasmatota archaeon]|nr:Histidinol phosphate phosphatase protein [Candidatus Thermoplasmatota archaeon]
MRARRCDFHAHTTLSDGDLLPMELIRRAVASDHAAIALTDHASFSNIEWMVKSLVRDCEKAESWGIQAIPGVELTHVPVRHIDEAVTLARKKGAELVVVHGETPVEPVEPGTDHVSVMNPDVDILAHPGMISEEDVQIAAENGVYLEISCRKGHSLSNGHVARLARAEGAKLLVNTDAHSPSDLSTMEFANKVGRGAGMTPEEVRVALVANPAELLKKLKRL